MSIVRRVVERLAQVPPDRQRTSSKAGADISASRSIESTV